MDHHNDKSQRSEKEVTLPKADKDLIQKYINELEKAKNEYVYPSEKEKVCPLYPLVAFPKMNNSIKMLQASNKQF